jgi:lysozyme
MKLRNLLFESITTDPDYIAYIKDQEGAIKDPRGFHKAYQDSVGVWTIGYGHTGADVKPGIKWPETKAEQQLKRDLQSAEDRVKAYITKNFPGKNINTIQLKMLTDFAFNLGSLSKFPKFTTAVVNKDWKTAAQNYKRFAGGKELTKRNNDFFTKFLKPLLSAAPAIDNRAIDNRIITATGAFAPKLQRAVDAAKQNSWTVQSGDTLTGIVDKLITIGYSTNVATIKKLNGLRSDSIQVGQKLKLK